MKLTTPHAMLAGFTLVALAIASQPLTRSFVQDATAQEPSVRDAVAFVREEGWWSAIDYVLETWSSFPPEEQEEIVEGIEKAVVEFIQLLDAAVGPRKVEIVGVPKVSICDETGLYCAEIWEEKDQFGTANMGLKTH